MSASKRKQMKQKKRTLRVGPVRRYSYMDSTHGVYTTDSIVQAYDE